MIDFDNIDESEYKVNTSRKGWNYIIYKELSFYLTDKDISISEASEFKKHKYFNEFYKKLPKYNYIFDISKVTNNCPLYNNGTLTIPRIKYKDIIYDINYIAGCSMRYYNIESVNIEKETELCYKIDEVVIQSTMDMKSNKILKNVVFYPPNLKNSIFEFDEDTFLDFSIFIDNNYLNTLIINKCVGHYWCGKMENIHNIVLNKTDFYKKINNSWTILQK